MQFNPNKRLTVEEVLKHPYLRVFTGKGCDITAARVFHVKYDEEKLTTKDYKALIYEGIKEGRREN